MKATDADLDRRTIAPDGGPASLRWVLFHLLDGAAFARGQIALLRGGSEVGWLMAERTQDRILRRLADHDLAVYSAEWCPDCTRLKALLSRERIPHRIVDVEADPAAADRLSGKPENGPSRISSWTERSGSADTTRSCPERLNPALLLRELAAAIDGPMKEKRT